MKVDPLLLKESCMEFEYILMLVMPHVLGK